MSEQDPRALTPPSDGATGAGWFAYAPADAAVAGADEDPVIQRVDLCPDEFAGPFWDDEGQISDDFDELHRWIGISRELFDEVMTWNEDATSPSGAPPEEVARDLFARQQVLLGRLGDEVHPGIAVPSPRAEPPTLVRLSLLRYDDRAGRLLLRDEDPSVDGPVLTLPPIPSALSRRVQAWVAERASYARATPENNDAIFAWQDEGAAVARELQQVLGGDYDVLAR